ncbi:immunoglobulin superfamily member 22-like [Haliotis rubra]|uniref:immunoglobulin superfamily member 22-like n=1 Tax=Haliotis rubra TaxID=36100 RepID=UPI001EE5438B|nr:immunoglobulin superfamily member 22-like [Haliotis rubra]
METGLEDAMVMLGQSTTFSVTLHTEPSEEGQWTWDDVTLSHSDKYLISVDGRRRQLVVTDTQLWDGGKYSYTFRDEKTTANLYLEAVLGLEVCDDLGVFIPSKTEGIELGLENQEVMLGGSATFRLRLRDDTVEAGEWTSDDVTLRENPDLCQWQGPSRDCHRCPAS